MSRDEIYAKLSAVFADVFDEEIPLSDEMTAADVEDMDSLTYITLLAAVEDEFGVRFDMKAVTGMENIGDMVDTIGTMLSS